MKGTRGFDLIPAVLAAGAFVICLAAFLWQFTAYQGAVRAWSQADLESRAKLAAVTLAAPLRTLDFKAIGNVADQLQAEGLRLRITQGAGTLVPGSEASKGFFDTYGEASAADIPCGWGIAESGEYRIGIGRPVSRMLQTFREALVVIALAALAGIAGVILFFFVTYRQRVRIRELGRLEAFRRAFIADVSHEIKTPLTGILGAVDMLEEAEEKDGGQKMLISLIRRETVRLNRLVQSILDLARLERERDVLHPAETDLDELVRATAAKYPCTVEGAFTRAVWCDPQLVAEALENLLGNAVRHSGTSDIRVLLADEGRLVRISVEDHGMGIPAEHAAHIFERFYRVDPSRAAETGGAGLGLAIVRLIARLHGGDAVFQPVSPSGARFDLTLRTSKEEMTNG